MERKQAVRFFLGANSRNGFFSLYDGFVNPGAGDFLHVIKGSPGCGKSTLMKRIGKAAEDAGLPVEYVLCSGDPDSLDGVWLPTLRTGYVDGTAPHVQEATFPGAASNYLDMSRFLDDGALRPRLPEIAALDQRYKALYTEAYSLLAAGAALLPRNCPNLWGAAEAEKLDKKLAGLVSRELRRRNKTPCVKRRFLSAISCRGRILLEDTLRAGNARLCLLDNVLGLGNEYLARLAALAQERGYDAVICHDPLEPERIEALLLPEAELAFLAAEKAEEELSSLPLWRHLRLDALAERDALREKRVKLRARKKESALLLERATDALAEAKALHDELEAIYRPHVDFAGTDALAREQIKALLGK